MSKNTNAITVTGAPVTTPTDREVKIICALVDTQLAGHLTRRAARSLEDEGIPLQRWLIRTGPHDISDSGARRITRNISPGELVASLQSWAADRDAE